MVVHPKLLFAIVEDVDGDDLYVSNDNATTFHKAILPTGMPTIGSIYRSRTQGSFPQVEF